MNRLVWLSAGLVALTACHEFTGDAGRLGFMSNLRVDGVSAWTPDSPIASGTRVVVVATERVDLDEGDAARLDVRGQVDGDVIVEPWSPERSLEVVFQGFGRTSALVTFSGEVEDWFTARFSPVVRGRVSAEPAAMDRALASSHLAVVPGSSVVLCPSLADRRGRSLGYHPGDLEIEATGGVSAWMEGGLVHLSADGADGESGQVTLTWRGKPVWSDQVVIVDASAVDELTVAVYEVPSDEGTAEIAVVAAWIDDDTRLLGAPIVVSGDQPLDWDADWPTIGSAKVGEDGSRPEIEIRATLGEEEASATLSAVPTS